MVKQGTRRPREKLEELNQKIDQLERDRTIVSISLKQEKEILWQMSRLEKTKRLVEEFQAYDQKVKAQKAEIATKSLELKQASERVSELRLELSMAEKASELGCSIEELLGMQLEVPEQEVGRIIGKKGRNVKNLQEEQSVSIDVAKGAVRIIGSLKSIDAAALNIDRVLAIKDETIEIPGPLCFFMTAKGIQALTEIRARHTDVKIDVVRADGTAKFRGIPEDIQSARNDLLSTEIVEEIMTVTQVESGYVVGKQGATVNRLVETHQAAIDVSRRKEGATTATLTFRGSISGVKDAVEEVEDILAQNKEETETIPVDHVLREFLLANKGVVIQEIAKAVNESCKDIAPGYINISIDHNNVKIKGKAIAMSTAVDIVSNKVRMIEACIVRLEIHPTVIPAIIGKGGAGIKKLKEGVENAFIDVDAKASVVAICGKDPDETETVVRATKAFLNNNQVRTIQLNTQGDAFMSQFRTLMKSPYWAELKELVTVNRDEESCEISIRGSEENLEKAKPILLKFLEEHHQDVLSITRDDLGPLLRGGKESKIEELAKEHEVRLNCQADKCQIEIVGQESNVEAARKALDRFLNGGDGVEIMRIPIDDDSTRLLVGRGGSTKKALEEKYPNVSISFPPNQTVVLRGSEDDVTQAKKHIHKLLVSLTTSERLILTEKMRDLAKASSLRGYIKFIPVQSTIDDSKIIVRGSRSDVNAAMSILKSKLGKPYASKMFLETTGFQKLQKISRESHLARIESATGTKISLDKKMSAILVSGKKPDVIVAKNQLIQLLLFLLSGSFACESASAHALHLLGNPNQLGSIAEETCTFIYVDRDIESFVVSSSDPDAVARARIMIKEKVGSLDGMFEVIEFGVDGPFLAPKLIGRSGSNIKSLRKELEVTIEIDDKAVTLISEDSEKLSKAKERISDIVAKEQASCYMVELSHEDMSAFMGKKGIHVQEFEKSHNVRVQAMRKAESHLRITGEPDTVAAGKAALEEWLSERHGGKVPNMEPIIFNFDATETPLLSKMIGRNGRRVNELRKRCGCQIDIDMDNRTLKLMSGDADILGKAKKIVDDILEEERRQSIIVFLSSSDLSAFIGKNGQHIREFEKLHNVRMQALKSTPGALQISGDTETLAKAKMALDFWVAVRGNPAAASANEDSEKEANGNGAVDHSLEDRVVRPPQVQVAPVESDFPSLTTGPIDLSGIGAGLPQSWASVIVHNPSVSSPLVDTATSGDEIVAG